MSRVSNNHPCFSSGPAHNKGRIHLPVSPSCNIECRFCNRKINGSEDRPGVTRQVLSPTSALDVIRRSLELAPEISVVGIAGPGDPLASDYALETFRLVDKAYPKLLKCLSTNGLNLPDRADELLKVGIDTLTVTVNAVDPKVQAQICSRVIYHNDIFTGEGGAQLLINQQLAGIKRCAAAGITIKVNTVLVPELNAANIDQIAQAVAQAGAAIYNIIPLIPQFEFAKYAAPTCSETDVARVQAQQHIKVFRHCQHCRADAIGVPGGFDYGDKIYLNRVRQANTFSHG